MQQEVLNEDTGEGVEWLLEFEKPAQNTKEDSMLELAHMREVAAEIESQDFEPLEPFEEDVERHKWHPLKHRSNNPIVYGTVAWPTSFVATSGTLTALSNALPPAQHGSVELLGVFGGLGAMIGSMLGVGKQVIGLAKR